ncbi:MAG: hypothetical protein V7459_07055 [Oceanicoccus sp.]
MLHSLHRASALFIGIFIVLHLLNHLFILGGVEQHISLMEIFRLVYRNVVVEVLLLISVLFQVSSGIYFVWKNRGQRVGYLEKAQAVSGLYLAFFFVNHIGAVLFGRIYLGLDTNIYYGIAGFHVSPFYLYFVPYYFLAIVSLFIHMASAFNWLARNRIVGEIRVKVAYLIICIGILLSSLLMFGFGGAFSDITVPIEYRATYE